MKPEEMTLDECRDWLLPHMGWHRLTHSDPIIQRMCEAEAGGPCWQHDDGRISKIHPIPATLDAISACVPLGWKWERSAMWNGNFNEPLNWRAYPPGRDHRGHVLPPVEVRDSGDELLDRIRLAVAVCMLILSRFRSHEVVSELKFWPLDKRS